MMTRITCGIYPLVYIKPDYIIIFFYNIRTYFIYLLIFSKLRSRREDSLEVSNTYLSKKFLKGQGEGQGTLFTATD
jgi:hypothetical protein